MSLYNKNLLVQPSLVMAKLFKLISPPTVILTQSKG